MAKGSSLKRKKLEEGLELQRGKRIGLVTPGLNTRDYLYHAFFKILFGESKTVTSDVGLNVCRGKT